MWARIATALLGAWLMGAPAVLDYGAPAATSDRIAGPVAATFAIIAIFGVVRGLRWMDAAVGMWVLVAPLVLRFGGAAAVNDVVVGLLMIGLAVPGGETKERFGGGWSALWR